MSLYTTDVQKIMYWAKDRLPDDFQLITRDEKYFIVIEVPMDNFDWRAVEGPGGRLEIAVLLEKVCQLVKGLGIECVIEKA